MADVEIRDLHKSYGVLEVMHGVSIDIESGQFVALVGPSGCGKSTLLRMIAGLEEVTSGEIRIGGEVVNDIAPGDRDIAMVFQSYALYPHMSARKNMAFSLRLAKVDKAEITRRVERAAEILGLESVLERLPGELSGGQRQRVAMGRAIVRDPVAFLFDEPLSNLDAKLRVQMRAEIKDLHQRLGTTTIYVTHDQIEAMTLADKVVVLNSGRIEQQGTPLELYDTPETLFVAGFIGSPSMNFLEGKVVASGDRALLTQDGIEVELPVVEGLEAGRNVTLGFRPEHLGLSDRGIPCQVQVVEPTGAETYILARSGTANITAVFRERHQLSHGMSVTMSPDLSKAHVFDAQTGLRLVKAKS